MLNIVGIWQYGSSENPYNFVYYISTVGVGFIVPAFEGFDKSSPYKGLVETACMGEATSPMQLLQKILRHFCHSALDAESIRFRRTASAAPDLIRGTF